MRSIFQSPALVKAIYPLVHVGPLTLVKLARKHFSSPNLIQLILYIADISEK